MADDRRHPADHEREAAARPALAALIAALETHNIDALSGLLREDAAWLSADGTSEGPAARRRARGFAAEHLGRRWADPQQRGAHAVLRWGASDGGAIGALVVEVRAGQIVLVCEVP
jgi:hypothetical protein